MGAIKFVPIFFVYSFGFLDTDSYNIYVTTNLDMEDFTKIMESKGLVAFRSDDFEYDITESFRGRCVPLIDMSDHKYPIVEIKWNGHLIVLHYKRDVFTGSTPYFYTLVDCDYFSK